MKTATPSISSFYFTKGKEYPIISENENGSMTVLCDKGFERCIDEGKSAHLWIPKEYYNGVRHPVFGRFSIREHKCTKEGSREISSNWDLAGLLSHYMECEVCKKNWSWA